jgi:hypothetical protein
MGFFGCDAHPYFFFRGATVLPTSKHGLGRACRRSKTRRADSAADALIFGLGFKFNEWQHAHAFASANHNRRFFFFARRSRPSFGARRVFFFCMRARPCRQGLVGRPSTSVITWIDRRGYISNAGERGASKQS